VAKLEPEHFHLQAMANVRTSYCHGLVVIANANLWVYDDVHPIYKSASQQRIYNQFVHFRETHDIKRADDRNGLVVGGEDVNDEYN